MDWLAFWEAAKQEEWGKTLGGMIFWLSRLGKPGGFETLSKKTSNEHKGITLSNFGRRNIGRKQLLSAYTVMKAWGSGPEIL